MLHKIADFAAGRRPSTGLWIALSFALAAMPAAAELAKWDQGRVTTLATQLVKATDALYTTVYDDQGLTGGAMASGGASLYDLRHTLRRVGEEAHHLDAELKAGKGHDATVGAWKQMMQLVRDARVNFRESFTPGDLETRMAAVEDLLRQLAPYYDPKSDAKKG
jgi:hypothetical protein